MTKENKELLIKDLCRRLPYGVIVQVNDGLRGIYDRRLVQVFCDRVSCSVNVCNPLKECICIDSVKPYLSPLSSMTEEDKDELFRLCTIGNGGVNTDWESLGVKIIDSHPRYGDYYSTDYSAIDWLDRNMFDYRGLIPKGLALEAPEGMYELALLDDLLPSQNESDSVIDNTTQITVGCKIRSKTNPDEILRIVSDDCHGDKFECSNGYVLSLKQIKKHYDLYIEENKGTIIIN